MRILLVEDEPDMVHFIQQGLSEAGYVVDAVLDGREGLAFALASSYDVIVLDIMLPNMDGFEVLQEIRKEKIKTPVLLLTARDAVDDRVRGLDSGADDYLGKPFAFVEFVARIRALTRRPPLQSNPILRAADLEMNLATHEVWRAGNQINLTPREFTLLETLMRHRNQVLTRIQIAQQVWGFDYYADTNALDVYIGYLRRKIDKNFETPLIQTVRGIGYRLLGESKNE